MKRALTVAALFVLTVLEILLGLVAGSVALLSLIVEGIARGISAGANAMTRRCGAAAVLPQLRVDLSSLFSATTPAGGVH